MIEVLPPVLVPAVNSEVRKVTTLRWTWILGGLVPAIALVASAVTVALAGQVDHESDPATGAATIGLYLGLLVAIVTAGVFGAAIAGAEFRYSTMPMTALFTADRDRIAAAKLLVTAGFALVLALSVEILALGCLVGFGRGKFDIDLRLLAVLGAGLLAAACWSVIGAGLGLMLHSSTSAIGVLLGWLLVIEPLTWLVANGLGIAGIATLLPGSATIGAVAVGSFSDSDLLAPTPAAIVVLLLWSAGIAGTGWWLLRTNDL